MFKTDHLYLHEEVLLLALHDEAGKIQGGWFNYAMGGAILAELLLAGRVTIETVKKKKLLAMDRTSMIGEQILDECLLRVQQSKRRATLATWVTRFSSLRKLRERTADRLCLRGILQRREGRVLLVFSRMLYPTVDPRAEQALVERMRQAIFEDGEVDVRTAAVTTIAFQTGLLRNVFKARELRSRKTRLNNLPMPSEIELAIQEAVAAAKSAMAAASTAAVMAATG